MCKPYAFEIDKNSEDDSQFIAVLQTCLSSIVRDANVDAVRVIHIDNWFDKKWLNFSGKRAGAIGLHLPEVTIPPFHPDRVLDERILKQSEDGDFEVATNESPLHTSRTSESNTRLPMDSFSPTVTAWYSGKSAINHRAALMLYNLEEDEPCTWYVGLEQQQSKWMPVTYSGITEHLFTELLSEN